MAQASRSGGLLPPLATMPPLRAQPRGTEEKQWQRKRAGALRRDVRGWLRLPAARSIPCLDPRPGGTPRGQPLWAVPADAGEHREAGAVDWGREPAAGGPTPPALQRLRAVLLRLHHERQELLQAQDCARHLQATVRLLRILSPGAPSPGHLPQLCRDLLAHPSGGAVLRSGLQETPESLPLARSVGLAAQRLDATMEMQLRALGQAPASPGLSSQIADLLLALPAYHQLQGKALSYVPGAARPYPPAHVLRLLAGERGCQVAGWLDEALRGSDLRDQLRRRCQEERELLPGLLGLMGGVTGSASSGLGLGGAGALWSQYWTMLWAACAQSLDLSLGPWRDPTAAAQQLSQALGQGFCQALGSASGNQSSLPSSSQTTELLQQLFPPLLDALREPRSGLLLCRPPGETRYWGWGDKRTAEDIYLLYSLICSEACLLPKVFRGPSDTLSLLSPGPAPLSLGLCTLQTTLLWFWGRTQQHLAAWAPGSFLLLIQKDLPPLLCEAEALSSLASEESLALEVEQQLGLEIQKLTAQIQLLPEESLSLFFQECHKRATQDFELHMPRGRYWRHRLCPELPSIPSEYAGLVVRRVLEPVLQGLQGLPHQAQAPALSQALTAILGAWLDHILTHGIRFSLQGALQLRQDFGVVRELLEEEQWGLSPELRQTLFTLSIFQRLDGALLCLLQQPLPKTQVHRGPPCCCACNEVQTMELPSSSLNSLESLEPPLRPGALPAQTAQLLSTLWGEGPSPEAYLVVFTDRVLWPPHTLCRNHLSPSWPSSSSRLGSPGRRPGDQHHRPWQRSRTRRRSGDCGSA
ncbi:coiled-coil domain-containing protein 142 isoform X2 [Balaenoptera acutorostrata]|uniref:Coiled-coil domain-containing protein 142 isoform X2 n=1 Tax=Balaenoptera acutorostrata TaxID=9767 RepID=A0ABM3UI62_BALAC|nr:coiled-coil domain-containing protein 142 isoform X2 [Balaenoptera acutorostrata]